MYTSRDLLKDIIKEAVIDVISERRIGTIKRFADEKKPPITANSMDVKRDTISPIPEKKKISEKNDANGIKDSKIVLYKRLKNQAM